MKKYGYSEKRTISYYNLCTLCITNHWFTRANCQQYDEFLTKAAKLENITTDDLVELATDVMEWSDVNGAECEDIMWEINKACNFHFISD